eukprot:Gb_14202 [translate_table: standard]
MGRSQNKMNAFLFVFLLLSPSLVHSHPNNSSDHEALLRFKSLATHSSNTVFNNWHSNLSFCNWRGVECSSTNHRVVALNLTGKSLDGSISPFLSNLSFLTTLDLSNNSLQGPIPPLLGTLFRLQRLKLSFNLLSGHIPTDLSRCRSLMYLNLNSNSLQGSIPVELGVLPRLEFLYLRMNKLSGTIPPSLANISCLVYFNIGENYIRGTIPPQFGRLSNLEFFHLGENQLVGQIPTSLSNCTALTILVLYVNYLTGIIPPELGAKLTNLEEFYVWQNQVSGNIPNTLGNCSQMTLVDLEYNQLTGSVPLELGKLSRLEFLNLGANQLDSSHSPNLPFLTALTNCSILKGLSIRDNQLSGVLPFTIGQLSKHLSIFNFSGNNIRGKIPPQIGNLTGLTTLYLSSNLLTGPIPSTALQGLQKLERLYLDNNKLQGRIPREIDQLKTLGALSVASNMLSGQIPETIGHLQNLRELYLTQNQLSGKIPASLGSCSVLEALDLSYNKLSGTLPPQVASLPNLILYLNLSSNSLQGSLPLEIGKLARVEAIDLSANHFSGAIPGTFESCVELQYLNISHNAFDGPIPLSFQNLNLENMDLSSNNLSGTIPAKSLAKLKMLHHLNFSFNNFTGEVAEDGIFKNLSAASFKGNPGLCGARIHLRMCPAPTRVEKHGDHSLLRKIVPSVAAVIILCCLIVAFYWSRSCRRRLMAKDVALKVGHRRISYEELVNATDNFGDNNLVGVGSFGSVYKGILNDGTMAAVKILNLHNEEADKSLTRECRVLSRVRHRNLVGIITSFSNLDFKALVLPFMSNGSLEKRLYPRGNAEESVRGLSFKERLNVAMDIAHAIEYLHHDSSNQIVHCDLKPANVLLDDDMTAHVADFGIARLVFANSSTDALSSTLAVKGSAGYIAPEYGLGGRTSTKGDVYSYGIVVLELVTGKKPTSDMFEGELNLRKWVSMAFPERVEEIVDECLLRDMRDERREEEQIHNCLNPLIYCVSVANYLPWVHSPSGALVLVPPASPSPDTLPCRRPPPPSPLLLVPSPIPFPSCSPPSAPDP